MAAQLMGVNVTRVIVTTFMIGGFFGGVAGTLYGLQFGNVAWNMGFIPGIKAFTAAVLGGIGNIRGAMSGGLLLGLIENMSVVCIGSEWKNVVAFVVLALVLILRPTGSPRREDRRLMATAKRALGFTVGAHLRVTRSEAAPRP